MTSARWLIASLAVALAAGATAVALNGEGSSAPDDPSGGSALVKECPGSGDNGEAMPSGTDLVRVKTSGSLDGEVMLAAEFEDDVPDGGQLAPGKISLTADFVVFPIVDGEYGAPYSFFVASFGEGYRVRGAAIEENDGQGGGLLDPTMSRVDVDGHEIRITTRADAMSRIGPEGWTLRVQAIAYQFQASRESVTDLVDVDTSGDIEIGRETCPRLDGDGAVAAPTSGPPSTTSASPPGSGPPSRPSKGEPGSLVLAMGLSHSGQSDLGTSECEGGPSLCSQSNRINWALVFDEIVAAVEEATGRTMYTSEVGAIDGVPANAPERTPPGGSFRLTMTSDGTVDVNISVLSETSYSWVVESVSDLTTEGA